MGAELGVTFSIFPSDTKTKQFLKAQKREDLWKEVEIMEGPYPERISKDINPYKGGYAKLYKFKY